MSTLVQPDTIAVNRLSVATSMKYFVAVADAFQFAENLVCVIAVAAEASGFGGKVTIVMVFEFVLVPEALYARTLQ